MADAQPRDVFLEVNGQKVDGRKRLHRDVMGTLRVEWPAVLTTAIPNASVVERMGPERAPVGAFAPSSAAAAAFVQLWAEVSDRLWI